MESLVTLEYLKPRLVPARFGQFSAIVRTVRKIESKLFTRKYAITDRPA